MKKRSLFAILVLCFPAMLFAQAAGSGLARRGSTAAAERVTAAQDDEKTFAAVAAAQTASPERGPLTLVFHLQNQDK